MVRAVAITGAFVFPVIGQVCLKVAAAIEPLGVYLVDSPLPRFGDGSKERFGP